PDSPAVPARSAPPLPSTPPPVRRRRAFRRLQELALQFRRRQGSGEEKPLRLLAAARAQPFELPRTLDALGRHGDAQTLAERQDGVGDGGIARRAVHVAHERLVYLDAIGGEAGDVCQRG